VRDYHTIWVCTDCIMHHANGECGSCHDDENGHDEEPLSFIPDNLYPTMGMRYSDHSEDCPNYFPEGADTSQAPGNVECDCETNAYSMSRCHGCGSYLHGERHAMTLFDK